MFHYSPIPPSSGRTTQKARAPLRPVPLESRQPKEQRLVRSLPPGTHPSPANGGSWTRPWYHAARLSIDAKRCISVVRASRRALRALLSMRYIFDGIKKCPHPEEAAQGSALCAARGQASRPSRRTRRVDPAIFDSFTTSAL